MGEKHLTEQIMQVTFLLLTSFAVSCARKVKFYFTQNFPSKRTLHKQQMITSCIVDEFSHGPDGLLPYYVKLKH